MSVMVESLREGGEVRWDRRDAWVRVGGRLRRIRRDLWVRLVRDAPRAGQPYMMKISPLKVQSQLKSPRAIVPP
jgi:hypothetical protein